MRALIRNRSDSSVLDFSFNFKRENEAGDIVQPSNGDGTSTESLPLRITRAKLVDCIDCLCNPVPGPPTPPHGPVWAWFLNTSQLCVLSSKSVAPEVAVCSTAALLTVDYNRALSIAFAYNDSIYFSVASASIAHCSMISTVPCGATIPLCLSIFLWCSPIRLRLFLCFLPEECSRY